MGYFITVVPDEANWRIDSEQLTKSLTTQWPNAQIAPIMEPSRPYSIEWTIPLTNRSLDGMLNRKGTSIYLDSSLEDSAMFAVWFRKQVPDDAKLVFYDEDYNADTPLMKESTEQALIAALTEESDKAK